MLVFFFFFCVLQGLNFQLAAVLLSLGLYSYIEYGEYLHDLEWYYFRVTEKLGGKPVGEVVCSFSYHGKTYQ